MNNKIATQRANMPTGASKVLDRRSLAAGNKNLIPLLKNNQSVLDVGCGAGSITAGIAGAVKNGSVVGIDMSESLIASAREKYAEIENLSFVQTDVLDFDHAIRFDLITSARTLQWMSQYKEALIKLKTMLTKGGCLAILDYNHEKIEWTPEAPASMVSFYSAFLRWRAEAGMNNAIADDLKDCFVELGLTSISTSDESELVTKSDVDFYEAAGIWKVVAETRGKQMVADGYIKEDLRLQAIEDYDNWLQFDGESMRMYLTGTVGYN